MLFNNDSENNRGRLLTPCEIIREELKVREKRGELTHDFSPLLIQLTIMYRVTIFETKP